MDCFYCLSAWVALPFTPAVARREREALLVWPALSGAACLLERVTAREGRELRPASSAGDGAGRVEPARSG